MEKSRGREVNSPRASVWCRQIQTQVFLTPKPALLSTAPTAHQIERGRESAKMPPATPLEAPECNGRGSKVEITGLVVVVLFLK